MSTMAPDRIELRPDNTATADIQLPAVKSYTQATDEVLDTLRVTKAWFLGLGIAVTCLLIGATAWFYQIYMGLGVAGYRPPVMSSARNGAVSPGSATVAQRANESRSIPVGAPPGTTTGP